MVERDNKDDKGRRKVKKAKWVKKDSKLKAADKELKKEIKKSDKKPKKHAKAKKIILISILVIMLLGIIAVGAVIGVFFGMFGDELKLEKEDLLIGTTNSKAVDASGNVLAVLTGDEKRQIVSLSDMPEYLPKAYIAIEDKRFNEHNGVDIKRTVAAIFSYIINKGDSSFGGSTITQQLVKNITKESGRNWERKVKEWGRAYSVEKMLSKDQILELYLNILFVGGPSLHGVEMGSQYYFAKNVKDLSLAEAAFMAGINNSPNAYEPFKDDAEGKNSEKIKIRTKTVLSEMKSAGFIKDEAQYNEAVAKVESGLDFKQGTVTTNYYSYHTELAIDEVIKDYQELKGCSEELAKMYVYGSGLTINTTQVANIQERMEEEYKRDTWVDTSKKTKDKEGNWKKSQSAMVILDQKTGYVAGTVGGLGEKPIGYKAGLNRAVISKQTGSAMKPLAAIAPGLEEGLITAGSVYDDVPTNFGTKDTFKNYYGGYKGLSTVRYAIQISQNIVPVKILAEIGVDKSTQYLKKMGITSLVKEDQGLALALGGLTYGVSPLEMAGAYGMIANGGMYIEPTFYTTVTDKDGKEILKSKQEKRRVISEANAFVLQDILTGPTRSRRNSTNDNCRHGCCSKNRYNR